MVRRLLGNSTLNTGPLYSMCLVVGANETVSSGTDDPLSSWPVMTYEQFVAVLDGTAPACVLQDGSLVRWLSRTYPGRLRELKEAHAAGQPAPSWEA